MGKPTGFMEYERKNNKDIPVGQRIKNFKEFHLPLDDKERLADAMDRIIDMNFQDGEELSEKVSSIASPATVAKQLETLFLKLQDEFSD